MVGRCREDKSESIYPEARKFPPGPGFFEHRVIPLDFCTPSLAYSVWIVFLLRKRSGSPVEQAKEERRRKTSSQNKTCLSADAAILESAQVPLLYV